jgi:hypothetical protein
MALTQVAAGLLAGSITSSQISSVSGASLTGTQNIPKATLPTGSVLQVVQNTYATATTITNASTGLISTGLSASITPSSSSNKILVIVNQGDTAANQSGNGVQFAIFRNNAINLVKFANQHCYGTVSGSNLIVGGPSTTYLDSPATTSSTTYGTYFTVNANGGVSGTTQRDSTTSTITLMEIAA